MKPTTKTILSLFTAILVGLHLGWFGHGASSSFFTKNPDLLSPFQSQTKPPETPLLKYTFPNLAQQTYSASAPLTILSELNRTTTYTSYLFSYQTGGKTISGQLNLPTSPSPAAGFPIIVMLRGYVPLEIYSTGMGTKNAAAVLAENGFATIAPDFLGYGQSDPDLSDTWESRFIKPVQVAELLATLQTYPLLKLPTETTATLSHSQIGLWGHSNGGQIALATLEITGSPLPTTLWAPVTAPFPYSIAFFSDELPDEGKEQRAWIALFEKKYDAFGFSLTKNLDLLPNSTIQIHHGSTDEAALLAWSEEFVSKVEMENDRRATFSAEVSATSSAIAIPPRLKPIDIMLYRYPNTDHNLQPNWNTVVNHDVAFFKKELGV